MAKRNEDLKGKSAEELATILAAEREESAKRQEEQERRDNEREEARKSEERRAQQIREDRDRATNQEPTDEQWATLETKYDMTRDEIKKHWKLVTAANAGIAAELQGYRLKEAANSATEAAKRKAAKDDPQFPKYADLVDEFLADVPLGDKADPAKMEKHMDRAINYARGKARSSKRPDIDPPIRDGNEGSGDDKKGEGFGRMEVSGLPLTIDIEKRVPDEYRKDHSHPEKKDAVLMNERKKWNEQIPRKPR